MVSVAVSPGLGLSRTESRRSTDPNGAMDPLAGVTTNQPLPAASNGAAPHVSTLSTGTTRPPAGIVTALTLACNRGAHTVGVAVAVGVAVGGIEVGVAVRVGGAFVGLGVPAPAAVVEVRVAVAVAELVGVRLPAGVPAPTAGVLVPGGDAEAVALGVDRPPAAVTVTVITTTRGVALLPVLFVAAGSAPSFIRVSASGLIGATSSNASKLANPASDGPKNSAARIGTGLRLPPAGRASVSVGLTLGAAALRARCIAATISGRAFRRRTALYASKRWLPVGPRSVVALSVTRLRMSAALASETPMTLASPASLTPWRPTRSRTAALRRLNSGNAGVSPPGSRSENQPSLSSTRHAARNARGDTSPGDRTRPISCAKSVSASTASASAPTESPVTANKKSKTSGVCRRTTSASASAEPSRAAASNLASPESSITSPRGPRRTPILPCPATLPRAPEEQQYRQRPKHEPADVREERHPTVRRANIWRERREARK